MDRSELRRLAETASPGPWVACGEAQGGCRCGMIHSEPADAPVATATIGRWGDEYPSLRRTSPSVGGQFEVYTEMIEYGMVPDAIGKANMLFIAAANPKVVLDLLAEVDCLRRRVAALEGGQ